MYVYILISPHRCALSWGSTRVFEEKGGTELGQGIDTRQRLIRAELRPSTTISTQNEHGAVWIPRSRVRWRCRFAHSSVSQEPQLPYMAFLCIHLTPLLILLSRHPVVETMRRKKDAPHTADTHRCRSLSLHISA